MLYQRLLRYSVLSTAVAAAISLSACGGGGGGTTTNVVPTALTGTAAAGAPIIGQVTVKGSLGVSKSALIEADGSYSVDVTGLTAPYRLRAEGTVGGRTYKLHSYAEEADVGGNVNITPFTDLIVANAAQQIAESYFDSATPADLDPVEVDAQEDALQAKLQNVFDALGVSTAIDLLNSTFSADHSGLDAALDIVSIEVDPVTYTATITNLVENTTITDSVVDTTDNTDTLTVTDATALTGAVTDTQAIAAVFEGIQSAFASGLPTQAAIQDYFSADFYIDDTPIAPFLTDITTDPGMIGTGFSGISVSNLDSVAGTATVTFNFSSNGVMELEPVTWYAAKDATLGWQLRGDQRIVETYFSYHCNDYDGDGGFAGACGINTRFWDNDFTNNGTGDVAIASGTVSIIDGSDGITVKDVVYLGTPAMSSAGDVQVYDEAGQMYTWDWKGFGTALGEIDSSIFVVGDIIEYAAYTEALDISSPSAPAIAAGAIPVSTYTDNLLFAPATTGKYPTATAATVTAMTNFTLGNDLAVGWTLAAGTRINEILVEISDSLGNRIEIWDWIYGTSATSATFASSELDSAAATAAGLLSTDATYNLKVRIYAVDELTGQYHSRDYDTTIPGPGGVGVGLACATVGGPYSYTDFQAVISDCGPQPMTAADLNDQTFTFVGAANEETTFNTGGTGTFTNDGGLTTFNFFWSIDANGYLNIVDDLATPTFVDQWVAYGIDPTSGGVLIKAYNEGDNPYAGDMVLDATADGEIFGEIVVPVGVATGLTCGYESGWNDATNSPLVPNSLDDFNAVLTDCGGALSVTEAALAGTWEESPGLVGDTFAVISYDGAGNGIWEERIVVTDYSTAGATVDSSDPFTYTIDGVTGYVTTSFSVPDGSGGTITGNELMAVYSSSNVDPTIVGTVIDMKALYEDSTFADTVFDSTQDGEIWGRALTRTQ